MKHVVLGIAILAALVTIYAVVAFAIPLLSPEYVSLSIFTLLALITAIIALKCRTALTSGMFGFFVGAAIGLLIGGGVIVHFGSMYLAAERERLFVNAQKIEVIAAATNIPAGTTISANDLGRMNVFKLSVPESRAILLSDAGRVIGKRLRNSVSYGDVIMRTDIEEDGLHEAGPDGESAGSPSFQP